MGLFKAWKEAKAVITAGAPSAPTGQPREHRPGMMAGFAGVMAKMMGPMLAAQAPERGDPLPATEPGALDAQDPVVTQAAVAAVRARDAAFDPQVLTTFAEQVFAAVSSAWGTSDASAIRGVLADDLWNPLSATLASAMAAGAGQIYSHQVGRAALTGLWAGAWYDTARFSIAVDLNLPAEMQHQAPPGSTSWSEDWLLQRSVQPGGDPMGVPETCPSCGAPTATDAAGVCTHCHQPVPVVTAGWLVTCIRSHNPTVELMRDQMVASLRANPEELKMVPDDVIKLLPASTVAELDPERAARLGLTPSR